MGMGLRGRRGRRGRAGRRNRRRRIGGRRRRRGGGAGLGRLILMCCGGKQEDPMERNREDILELYQAQQLMLISLNQQGTMVNTSINISQPGGVQTVNTWGAQPQYNGVMATQYSGVVATQHHSSMAATQQLSSVAALQNPGASTSAIVPGPSSGLNVPYNAVAPQGTFGATAITDHQTNQLHVLNDIQAQLGEKNDPETLKALHSQYNDVVEQMRQMESLGYTYPGGVPPSLVVVDNPQHGLVTDTAVPMT